MNEVGVLWAFLAELGVGGFMVSPAYAYEAVNTTNPTGAARLFMTRDDVHAKFLAAKPMLKRFRLVATPLYLDFLCGERELDCAAWANPTRNVGGWRGPCYLLGDAHYKTYAELVAATDWSKYGPGNDPPLRKLPDALRFRAFGRDGVEPPLRRHAENGHVADDVKTGKPCCVCRRPPFLFNPRGSVLSSRSGLRPGVLSIRSARSASPAATVSLPGTDDTATVKSCSSSRDRGAIAPPRPPCVDRRLSAAAGGFGRIRRRPGSPIAATGPGCRNIAVQPLGGEISLDPAAFVPWLDEVQNLHRGRLLTVDRVVRLREEKQQLGRQHDALAVDMESFAVAEVCRQRAVDFLAVRSISDAVDEELPPDIGKLLAQKSFAGQLGVAMGSIFRRPAAVKDLFNLHQNALASSSRLARFLGHAGRTRDPGRSWKWTWPGSFVNGRVASSKRHSWRVFGRPSRVESATAC